VTLFAGTDPMSKVQRYRGLVAMTFAADDAPVRTFQCNRLLTSDIARGAPLSFFEKIGQALGPVEDKPAIAAAGT